MRHCDVRCPVLTHSVSVQNCQQAEVSGEHQLLQQHGGALDLHHLLICTIVISSLPPNAFGVKLYIKIFTQIL